MTDELGDDYECQHGCGAELESPTDLSSHMQMCDGDGTPDGYDKTGTPENYHPDSEFDTADTMTEETGDTQAQNTNNDVESNYDAAWVGGGTYVVTNGTNTYTVELTGEDGPEVDAHDEYNPAVHEAINRHHDSPNLEHNIMLEWAGIIRDAENTLQTAEAALDGAKDAEVAARSAEADAAQNAVDSSSNGVESKTQHNNNERAEEAAERLQSAFDDVIDDMQVTASSGVVWIKKGRDTPDTLPGPGNVDTWETFIKNPDQTEYVYESDDGPNHELFSEKPGEYWKSVIRPSDVDEYIDENLEVSG